MSRASCLYQGMVRHRRFEPIEFGFRIPIQLLYLDLAELDSLFAGSRLWSIEGASAARYRRVDHLGPPDEPLDASLRRLVAARLGRATAGPIRLLTSPRYLGLVFNPISLYYCFSGDGQTLDALVAEVTNTPWAERHCYVIDLAENESDRAAGGRARRRVGKRALHASPFMETEMDYEWRILPPGRSLTLSVRSELSKRPPAATREFEAPYSQSDLVLQRSEIDPQTLRKAYWRAPFQSGRLLFEVYRQAFRLMWRRVPRVKHPDSRWPTRLDDPALFDPPPSDPDQPPSPS